MTNQVTTRCPNCFAAGLDANCKFCGWQPGLGNPSPALALGVVLDGRYRIGRVLGHGGFGITYLAWDDNLHLRLAIKEYLPRDSATRAPDGTSLSVYSGAAEEQFAYGLDRFLEEARTLARFDQHPGIVTVKNFFRAHGTGYCVMEYVEGITLRRYLEQQPGGRISVADALKLLMPVADALKAVHKDGLLHRDIAPDNIYLTQDGRVKLLDFGAARFAAGEHSKSLSVILKPGYAPEEQYRARGKQGPWTDVYGLGATLYRAITGQVPPDSLDRLDQDELVPPSRLGVAIPPTQEAHLLKALAIKAEGRWQNIEQLQDGWRSGNSPLHATVIEPAEAAPQPSIEERPPVTINRSKSTFRWSVLGALLMLMAIGGYFIVEQISYPIASTNPLSTVGATTVAAAQAAFDKGDHDQAFRIFKSLAESGDAHAQFKLGYLYDNGYGVRRNATEALHWYRNAAEQGNALAQVSLGEMYHWGRVLQKNEAEATRLFQQALPSLRKAVDQHDPFAQVMLGTMYIYGFGIKEDHEEGNRLYRSAAEQGNLEAQVNLGIDYLSTQDGDSFRWLNQAAAKGHGFAQNLLGDIYMNGTGVIKNDSEAVRWYRMAADRGEGFAQYSLGMMYYNGRGVKQDYDEALKLFQQAAEQGHPLSYIKLGEMYERGVGVQKNPAKAIEWYRKAAENGATDAIDALKRLE